MEQKEANQWHGDAVSEVVRASYSQIFVSHGRDCGLNLKARVVMPSLEERKVPYIGLVTCYYVSSSRETGWGFLAILPVNGMLASHSCDIGKNLSFQM